MPTFAKAAPASVGAQIAARDFSRSTLQALASRGCSIIGLQAIPDVKLGYLMPSRGYLVDDHGTGRVWTLEQVIAAAFPRGSE